MSRPSKSPEAAMNKLRRKELATLRRERNGAATSALRQVSALKKQAAKIVSAAREKDARLARRIAILESRLG